MELTTDRRETKHEELTRILRELIASLRPGDRFPSQTELMRTYRVSDRTVLRSLDDLSRGGWIVRRRGSGTYVADRDLPRFEAPALRETSSTIAALALTGAPSPFYQRCLDVLSLLVEEAGASLVCQHAPDASGYEDALPLEALDPRGFIVLNYRLHPIARRLWERGHRTVIVGAPPADVHPDVPCVMGDHELGAYQLARHLLELGHRRLAYLRVFPNHALTKTPRWRGHLRAEQSAQREGLGAEWRLLEAEQFAAWQADPALAARYFRGPDAPTAVIAWNDNEAGMLLRVCQAAGLRVPDELSVVGYDALPEGENALPPLTTVDQHVPEQLRYALDLLSRPDSPPPTQSVIVLPTLVRRASCAPPACR